MKKIMIKLINFQRHRALVWAFCLATAAFGLTACSDDDEKSYPAIDNAAPTLTLASDHIQIEPSYTFTISGVAKDNDGLKSIILKNSDMYLDKKIDFYAIYPDSLLHEYNLSYSYDSDNWETKDSYTVDIEVEDVVGNKTSGSVLVTPDGDNTAPTFDPAPSSSIALSADNPTLTVSSVVKDNKGLASLSFSLVDSEGNSYAKEDLTISGTEYNFELEVPLSIAVTSYTLSLTATDAFGNTTSTSSSITISSDYSKMYLADVSSASELTSDLFGVPMLIDHVGENKYQARYYNKKAGTEIRFIPQKTSFAPACFGLDNDGKIVNSLTAKPIVLNKVGYYQIDLNTETGDISMKTYTPSSDDLFPQGETLTEGSGDDTHSQPYELSLAGTGLPGAGSWSTSNPFVLTQDATNKFLFYGDMTLDAGAEIEFTITPKSDWGWWPSPFYRFEKGEVDSGENEYNTKNDGNNMTKVTVKTAGKYRFEFDTHLLRSKFYPIN